MISALEELIAEVDGVDNGYCKHCHRHRLHDLKGNPQPCSNPDCWSNRIRSHVPPPTEDGRPCRYCGGSGQEPDPVALGIRVKAVRERKGLSLRQVGALAGCSHVYVADLEAGRRPHSGLKAGEVYAVLGLKR